MNRHPTHGFALRSLGGAALLGLAACASPLAEVPAALRPAAGEVHALTTAAWGVQIYECRATADAAPAWAFVAPEAELYDAQGRTIGRHGAGPFWQVADGSRVVGAVKARADAPVTGAIPWLLLSAQADRLTGPQGSLSRITSIQRVNTAGGTAPVAGCSRSNLGAIAKVAYTADYHFFSAR
ncbi:MAG: DUF3455 domain-containing protein [Pseudomonadota bacterium]